MKQLTYILLMIGVVQLLLTVCAVQGKKHGSDKSDRSERGRAAKRNGGEKLESEEICTKGDDCQSGNCCPMGGTGSPQERKLKACFKEDCSSGRYGQGKTANPPIHEWETPEKWYKLFIREYSNVIDASIKCCDWKKNARLALVNTDPVYDNVFAEIVNGMKTKQNANKAESNIEATVRVDGTDVDQEENYVYAFAENLKNKTLDNKLWYTAKGEPNHSPMINCAGIKYYSSAKGKYKFATVYCHSNLPFLCEASKTGNKG